MAVIGKIIVSDAGGVKKFRGQIHTLQYQLSFELRSNPFSTHPDAPDYTIHAHAGDLMPQIGAAWKKTSFRHDGDRKEFLSLTFDDPSFEQALNVAAFEQSNGEWHIVWRRRQQKQPVHAQQAQE